MKYVLLALFMMVQTFPIHAQEHLGVPKKRDQSQHIKNNDTSNNQRHEDDDEIAYPTLNDDTAKNLKRAGTVRIVAIIDGLRLVDSKGVIYQLSSLDIPDLFQAEPGEFSLKAKELLENEFKDKEVYIYQTLDPKAGRSNRMEHSLVHIIRKDDQVWAQGMLLIKGLARVRTTNENRELASMMLQEEANSRSHSRGLWKKDDYKIHDMNTVFNASQSFQIIEGKILKIGSNKNRIYLNFGERWQDDFTVSISPEARRLFSKEGLDIMTWQGKTIRVRGMLENYNGPYIDIDHPERIEFIDSEPEPLTQESKDNALPDAP